MPQQQGMDSRALFATIIRKLPMLCACALIGAAIGSGLYLVTACISMKDTAYVSETEFYIDFPVYSTGAKDYYNAFTWNDVLGTDLILERVLELLGSGYGREQVKGMVSAEMLSDIRYLTVFVRGGNVEQVEQVRDAFSTSIEEFGARVDEFVSIKKIDDLAVRTHKLAL